MSMMSEFKEFAIKGNAIDMTVGIVIGAELGKIVSSFGILYKIDTRYIQP